jgi:hypothetical protein
MMVVSEIVNHSFCIPISSNFFYCKSRDELLRKDYDSIKIIFPDIFGIEADSHESEDFREGGECDNSSDELSSDESQ